MVGFSLLLDGPRSSLSSIREKEIEMGKRREMRQIGNWERERAEREELKKKKKKLCIWVNYIKITIYFLFYVLILF